MRVPRGARRPAARTIGGASPRRVAAALAATGLCGCSTLIVPPSLPAEPVTVFVADHGRTSSLVIPSEGGGMLRYAYGDWRYYALGRTDLLHGIAALLWPTQGALGRAALQGPATAASVRDQVPWLEALHPVSVDLARVRAFERRMEALHASRRETLVENPVAGLAFVHHPQRYTYFRNSNHAVAAWLRELGCETRGPAFRASWRVAPAASRGAAAARRSLPGARAASP